MSTADWTYLVLGALYVLFIFSLIPVDGSTAPRPFVAAGRVVRLTVRALLSLAALAALAVVSVFICALALLAGAVGVLVIAIVNVIAFRNRYTK